MTTNQKPAGFNQSALGNEMSSIGRHSVVYFIGQASSRAVGFLMIPIYTRFIAPSNYGAMELIEILAACVGIVISMGVSDAMPRFYYAEKEKAARDRVVSTIIISLGLIGIPVVIVSIGLAKYLSVIVFDDPQYEFYLQITLIAVWFGMLCEVGFTYLRMQYMAKVFVAMAIIQLVLALCLNLYFVTVRQMGILGIFYSTLITQSVISLFLITWILRKVQFAVSIPLLGRVISFGLPIVPSRIGLMLGFMANRFFLRWMGSADPTVALAQVGLFSLGHKFGVIINRFINVPFNSFWGPRRLELLLGDEAHAKESVARVCTYATMGAMYVALLLSSSIESLIDIMADPSYYGAHRVVPFVALSYVGLGLETHFSTGILYSRKTTWITFIGLLALALILLWNYIFVPRYGLIGAATSNLAGLALRCTLIYIASQRLYRIPFEIKRIAALFVTACVLYVVSQAIIFSSAYLTFLARIGIASLFPLVLYLLSFFRDSELEFMGQRLRKGRQATETHFVGSS